MSFCSCYKPETAFMKPCTICLILHGPQKSGHKKTNQPSQTGLSLGTGQNPNCFPNPPTISQHFKFHLLERDVHAHIYMQVIKASQNLLPNFLKMTTLHHKTLCVTQVTFLRSLTTQVGLFFFYEGFFKIHPYNSEVKPVLTAVKTFSHYTEKTQCNSYSQLIIEKSPFSHSCFVALDLDCRTSQFCKCCARAEVKRREPPSLQNVWGFQNS